MDDDFDSLTTDPQAQLPDSMVEVVETLAAAENSIESHPKGYYTFILADAGALFDRDEEKFVAEHPELERLAVVYEINGIGIFFSPTEPPSEGEVQSPIDATKIFCISHNFRPEGERDWRGLRDRLIELIGERFET